MPRPDALYSRAGNEELGASIHEARASGEGFAGYLNKGWGCLSSESREGVVPASPASSEEPRFSVLMLPGLGSLVVTGGLLQQ